MRYLIGTGNRNWNDPNNWSLTSGGLPYQPASGTEKITNAADREFSSDTGFWTKSVGITISGELCNYVNATGSIVRVNTLTIGKWYKINATILNYTNGSLNFRDGTSSTIIGAENGSFIKYHLATNVNCQFIAVGTTNLSIDNISVQEVDTIAPDATTSCIFDANSGTGTITVNSIANMLDFTCDNIGALTLANAAYAFNVYGSLTLHTSLTVSFTSTGYLYMKATDSRTITTNDKVANWNRMYFDGVGGSWTNQDDMNVGFCQIYHKNGSWITNDKIISIGYYFTETGTKTLTLGSSIFNITGGAFSNTANTGLTFNAGTSTVNIYPNVTHTFNNITFYNIAFIGSGQFYLPSGFTASNNLTITGTNATTLRIFITSNTIGTSRTITCNGTVTASNVDFRDITGAGLAIWNLSAITGGSGDCGGNSGIVFTTAQPQYFKTSQATANYGDLINWRTGIETLGSELVSNGDFSSGLTNWTIAQTPTTSVVEVLSNQLHLYSTGVICSASQICIQSGRYYKLQFDVISITGALAIGYTNQGGEITTSINTAGTKIIYFNSLGTYISFKRQGTIDALIDNISIQEVTNIGRVPLPQDLGSKFLATSFNQTCTVSCNVPRIPCLDMSEVVNTVTWSLANAIEVYGSYVLGNSITQSGNFYTNLMGRSGFNLNSYNKIIYGLIINAKNGTYTNLSNLTLGAAIAYGSISLQLGTFDLNDYDTTLSHVLRTTSGTYFYLGNGIMNLLYSDAVGIWDTRGTVYPELSTINFNPQSGSGNITPLSAYSNQFYKVKFSGLHTGNFDFIGSATIAELIIDSGRKVRFTSGTTQTIAKATIGANVTMDCITASTYNLALTEIATAENINIKGCTVTQDSKFFAEANSVDSGSNNRVVFGDYFTPQEILIE